MPQKCRNLSARRAAQRFEDWSGFPLRWFARRVAYAAGIAAWVGMAMALVVVTGHHEVVTVCTETACTP